MTKAKKMYMLWYNPGRQKYEYTNHIFEEDIPDVIGNWATTKEKARELAIKRLKCHLVLVESMDVEPTAFKEVK